MKRGVPHKYIINHLYSKLGPLLTGLESPSALPLTQKGVEFVILERQVHTQDQHSLVTGGKLEFCYDENSLYITLNVFLG